MIKPLKFKGYVNIRGLEAFIAGRKRSIIIHNDKAITTVIETEPVFATLFPIGQGGPDYEAICHEICEGAALFDIRHTESYNKVCDELFARHTPPGAGKKKPEGKDET